MKGPFEVPYEEGQFVPVPHGFVIVGTMGYWGYYWIIGTILFYFIAAYPAVGADTIACTTGVSYFDGFPRAINLEGPDCHAADVIAQQAFPGIGFNARAVTVARAFPPTFPASVEISVTGHFAIV